MSKETITWEEKTELVRLLNKYRNDKHAFWRRCMELLPKFDAQMFDMFITGIDLTEVEHFHEYFVKIYEGYLPHQDTMGWRSDMRYGVLKEYFKERHRETDE